MEQLRNNNNIYDEDAATVQLVGDMKSNIEELIRSIGCQCGTRSHMRAILTIYCDKINKLRGQRDYYRGLYEELSVQSKSYVIGTLPPVQGQSLASTNQASEHKRQSSNIFQMLHQQLFVPMSMQTKSFPNSSSERSNISFLLNQNSNPEDSLLISQQSRSRPCANTAPNKTKKSSHKQNVDSLAKSFEQFLQQKVQQKQMKMKISQDMASLSWKKNRLRASQLRKPLADRFY